MGAVMAVSSLGTTLAIIGLVIGVVVLLVVIWLLQGVLTPLRSVLADVQSAQTAPMLERGVPGTDQLGQTRRLADSVVPLALAYLQKVTSAAPPPPPPPPTYAPLPPASAAPSGGTQQGLDAPVSPAWKRYLER